MRIVEIGITGVEEPLKYGVADDFTDGTRYEGMLRIEKGDGLPVLVNLGYVTFLNVYDELVQLEEVPDGRPH